MSAPATTAPRRVNLPQWLGWRAISVVLAFAFCIGIMSLRNGMDPFSYRLVAISGLYVTLAVSLNLINGITGQFSIGHAAFYQVGAYTTLFLSNEKFNTSNMHPQVWLFLMVLAGGAAAAITGLIVGLPSLRLRGDYLAIVTLGFGEIIRIVCQNVDELGAAYGLTLNYGLEKKVADGINPAYSTVWLIWILAIVCIAVCRNLLKNYQGLAFLAVREDEVASSAMGVNPTWIKVSAFVLGSMFAGMAGALFAHHERFISPTMFNMELSFLILTMVVLGGTGSITGSVVAAVGLYYIPELIRTLKGPNNEALAMSGPLFVGMLFGVAAFVMGARMIRDKFHGTRTNRTLLYLACVAGAVIIGMILSVPFGLIPQLKAQSFEVTRLRMVIFSIVLIVMMLLRPQGLFGHREFSISSLLPKSLRGEAK